MGREYERKNDGSQFMIADSQLLPFKGFHFLVAHKKVEQRKHAALKNFLRNNGSLR